MDARSEGAAEVRAVKIRDEKGLRLRAELGDVDVLEARAANRRNCYPSIGRRCRTLLVARDEPFLLGEAPQHL
jgi:hypothetical protein